MLGDKTKLGVALFLSSESVFFVILILTYMFYRFSPANAGVATSSSLEPPHTLLYSVALFASSITMWLAGRSVKKQRPTMLRVWLAATIVLGAVFLFYQGKEYLRLVERHVTVSRDVFGTSFFTLTGFHGFHVFAGLVMLCILLGLALAGDFKGPRSAAVEAISWYWHFVDAVWVVIFAVVYLWVWVLAR